MSTLELREELGWCEYCGAFSKECRCYRIISWDWERPRAGDEIEALEDILQWGVNLAFADAPPRFDGPVLNVLPISIAHELEKYFLEVSLLDRKGYSSATGGFCMQQRERTRRTVYDVLLRLAAKEVRDTKQMKWPILSHPIINYTEVENPAETRKRVSALLVPALAAIETLQTQKEI